MALVGPITIQGSTSSSSTWIFKTVVTETAIDAAAKTHTVKVENYLGRHQNASNSSEVNWFGGTYTTTFQIGNEKKSLTLYKYAKGISPGTYVSIGSETFTITETSSPFKITVTGTMSTSSFTPSSASASGEVTLSVLHQAPIVSIDSIVESNSLLTSAGISGETFVPGISKKRFNVGAATFDNAKITKYGVHIATDNYHSTTTPIEINFAQEDMFWGYDENQNIITRIRFTATDDVGTTGSTSWSSYPVIPYEKPNLIKTSSTVKRNGQTTGKATLSLSGTFYNKAIGSQNNTITLQFKYWALNTNEPSTYNNIPSDAYHISGNNITLMNWGVMIGGKIVTDLDKSMSYNFKIRAVDAFGGESTITLICAKGEWLRAIFKDRIDFKKITQNGQQLLPASLINVSIPEYDITTDSWTDYQLALDDNILLGNDFNLSDNTIVITGDNVEYISISVLLKYMIGSASSNRAIRIMLNDIQISSDYYTYTHGTTDWGTDMISNLIVPVKKGDILKFYIVRGGSSSATTRIGAGYATVSVIKYK